MIDAHLAAMAWYAAVVITVFLAGFVAGMVHGARMRDREWQERVKWMRKR